MDVEIGSVRFDDLRDYCSRTFKHVADGKSLDFSLEVAGSLAGETVHTDAKRLQQVLKNLLSNALKFTERGSVKLRIDRAESGWSSNHPVLNRSKNVVAFSVTDTGIGIPQDKQRIIFEAFQQADGTTSRKRMAARALGFPSAVNWRVSLGARSGYRAYRGRAVRSPCISRRSMSPYSRRSVRSRLLCRRRMC